MICKSCASPFDDSLKNCPNCGAEVEVKNLLTPPPQGDSISYGEEPKEYIFCNKCGSKLLKNAYFCNKCGNKLRKDTSVLNTGVFPSPSQNSEIYKAEMFGNMSIGTGTNQSITVNDNSNYHRYSTEGFNNRTNKVSNAIFAIILICLFGVGLGGVLILSGDMNKGKKTLMVYMVGSNLETTYGLASLDIAEMINSGYDLNNMNVLLYTGGAKEWQTAEISSEDHGVYLITSEGIEKVKSFNKDKMGLSSTLSRFLNFGYENYKADQYGLILWDHGGGPINGYGADEFYKFDYLTLSELKEAIEDSPFIKKKLEFVGFDACLMSSVEVANSISRYSKYFISSEENEPGNGWNYDFLQSIKPSDDGKSIGKTIADYFADYYGMMEVDGITIGVMNLDKVDKVESAMNDLFDKINNNLDTQFASISRARSNTKEFGSTADGSFDLIDLYDFAEKLPAEYNTEKENLKSALRDAVIYFNTDIQGANGLSMYFPYYVKNKFDKSIKTYKTFGFAEDYLKFATNFTSKLTGVRRSTFDTNNLTPQLLDDNRVQVTLTDDMIENYSKVTYRIFEKTESGNYVPRFQGTDYDIEGNVLSTTINKKGITATDQEGNTIYLMAFEAERGTEYVKYLLPGTIEEYDGETYKNVPVFVHFVVNKEHPTGKIEGITKTEPDVDISSKTIIDLDKISNVIFMGTTEYQIFDENGKYTQEWKPVANTQVEMIEEDLNKIKIEFNNLDITKEHYFIFEIDDSQGNSYTTNPVKITK